MKNKVMMFAGAALFAIGLSMSQAHGSAQEELDLCDAWGDVAFTLMDARQQGVGKQVFLDSPETTVEASQMIERAWEQDLVEPIDRAHAANRFAKDERNRCLRKLAM